ncbi:uncharacterized protein Dana_GF13370 [Drosophila ananassae]|uniref:Peptidase S1 domain-containing protein n=2 Tax=Drosophila ananassae TaxID=7217 RepID=B3MCF7_DROAN|nr:uncharacterized protein Dana_GF13370 [Drosophila ananassae]
MVVLSWNGEFVCGGTLINNRYVLTAAHCMVNGTELVARLGVYDRSKELQCWNLNRTCLRSVEYAVEAIHIPASYKKRSLGDDIGLLRLDRMVVYMDHIRPICILADNRKKTLLDAISQFKASGWGDNGVDTKTDLLLQVDLLRTDWAICSKIFWGDNQTIDNEKENTKICGVGKMSANGRGDSCNGDSGGPIGTHIWINGGTRYTQLGVVSYGTSDCSGKGVYTNVMHYANWIKKTVDEADIKVLLPKKDLLDEACYDNFIRSDPYPWLATVYLYRFVLSYGALISKKFVMTTATFLPDSAPLEVGFAEGATYHVKAVNKHPDFKDLAADDIALLELADFVQYAAHISPICLPSTTAEAEVFRKKNRRLLKATAVNSDFSSNVEMPTHSQCVRYANVSSNQICTRVEFLGLSSGSPLVTTIVTGSQMGHSLVGLASYEGEDGNLTVYTSVDSYMPWILGLVNKTA